MMFNNQTYCLKTSCDCPATPIGDNVAGWIHAIPGDGLNGPEQRCEVLVYDRRTGRVMERKVFPGDDSCKVVRFTSNKSDTQVAYPPIRDIEAWLESLVRR